MQAKDIIKANNEVKGGWVRAWNEDLGVNVIYRSAIKLDENNKLGSPLL